MGKQEPILYNGQLYSCCKHYSKFLRKTERPTGSIQLSSTLNQKPLSTKPAEEPVVQQK